MTALLESYLDYLENTESPIMYHRWSFLTGVGALLARNVWFSYGHVGNIYPNMYTLLVGSPGTRKDSAIRPMRELVAQSGYTNFAPPGRTTAYDFVCSLHAGLHESAAEDLFTKAQKKKADGQVLVDFNFGGIGDKQAVDAVSSAVNMLNELSRCEATEGFICLGEFKDFLNDIEGEFTTLLTTLWDNLAIYEYKNLKIKKAHPARIINPTISILGGATPVGLHGILNETIAEQGLTSRVILVYGAKPAKRVPFPTLPSPHTRNHLVEQLEKIRKLRGEMRFSVEAKKLFSVIYDTFDDTIIYDARLQYYLSRRVVHLIKLCMIIAATELSTTIEVHHLVEANTILATTERFMTRALGEFGDSKIARAKQELVEKLQSLKEPVPRQRLYEMIAMHIDSLATFSSLLAQLESTKRIIAVQDPKDHVFYYSIAADFQPRFKSLPGIDINYIREIFHIDERIGNEE